MAQPTAAERAWVGAKLAGVRVGPKGVFKYADHDAAAAAREAWEADEIDARRRVSRLRTARKPAAA
ncbi:MAG: hypothetical protein JNK11_16780 [Alphaproteobacteria bacterium]|nr:hypothetical protein [Alphaproteobacteria bacterium]